MRTLTPDQLAALAAGTVRQVGFVFLDLDDLPLYLNTERVDIAWNGHTWLGVGQLASVEPLEENLQTAATGYRLTISTAQTSDMAVALSSKPTNRACEVYIGLYNEGHQLIGAPWLECRGLLDKFDVVDGQADASGIVTSTWTASVENELIDLDRPRVRRMTDADHQAEFPGDRFFEYVAEMAEREFNWGGSG